MQPIQENERWYSVPLHDPARALDLDIPVYRTHIWSPRYWARIFSRRYVRLNASGKPVLVKVNALVEKFLVEPSLIRYHARRKMLEEILCDFLETQRTVAFLSTEEEFHQVFDSRNMRMLSSGSYGSIYSIWEKNTQQELALKLTNDLDVSFITRREVEILRKANPNGDVTGILPPPLYYADYLTAGGERRVGFAMLRCEGSLLQFMREERLSFEQIESCIEQMLRGVAHLHSLGIRHKDIKMDNILVMGSRYYLADFGAAVFPAQENLSANPVAVRLQWEHQAHPRYLPDADRFFELKRTLGNPHSYLEISLKHDIYALGKTFAELTAASDESFDPWEMHRPLFSWMTEERFHQRCSANQALEQFLRFQKK